MKTEWNYETKAERFDNQGVPYISYGIFTRTRGEEEFIYHDVTLNEEDARELCGLLNAEKPEPEQARYIVEDYILGKYIVCVS